MTSSEQIKTKTFEKVAFGGYNVTEVNEYMAAIANDIAELSERNETLTEKMKVLVKAIEKYRNDEDTIKDALIRSQKLSAEMVEDARRKSDELMASAKLIAQNKIAEFKDEFRREELKLNAARRATEDFVRRVCDICEKQSSFLVESLLCVDPTLDITVPAKEEPPQNEEPQTDDAVVITPEMENRSIYGEDGEPQNTSEEETAEDEQKETGEQSDKEEPSLQFGKNYSL